MSGFIADTIFALASANGRAGVSVIRVSGAGAIDLCSKFLGGLPDVGQFRLRPFKDKDQIIDYVLALRFQAPHSFTGEDVIELHCHGSPAVVKAVLAALSETGRARMAEPGEFTRRALENNKLDLAQVEGLGDLINAETEAQRRQASRVFSGHLGKLVEEWRQHLLRATALIEVTIDFADEEVPTDVTPEVQGLITQVVQSLDVEIAGSLVAERIRDGFEVAIIGAPNAGKSTLLNAISGRDIAITSEIAGTTRDVIEVRLDLGGLPVTLLDTAGIRDSTDMIESIGVERAIDRAKSADLRVFLKSNPKEQPPFDLDVDDISILGKADMQSGSGISVSGQTGQGVDELIALISARLSDRAANVATATHMRHRQAMLDARQGLADALIALAKGDSHTDIAAEYVRYAIRKLDSLIGRVDVEMVLGEIFSQFCLGK